MTIEQIIKDNSSLIYNIATKFYGENKEDLFQAGVLGVLKAYKNYKQNSTCKFTSYAYDYIYGEMYTLVNNHTIKINKELKKLYYLIEKTRYTLAQKIGKVPSNIEIAKVLDLPVQKIDEALMIGEKIVSLDNDESVSLYDTVKSEDKVHLDDKILLSEGIALLSADEQKIIKARYYEDLTQSEVAKKLAMTQVMVSRYEKRSLSKMQKFMMQ